MTDIEELKALEDYKHKLRMEELEYERVTDKINHQNAMEHHRVKNAEDKKRLQMAHHFKTEEIRLRDKMIKSGKHGKID